MTDQELLDFADKAKEKAYAPYSRFQVGAAILTKEGKVFTGCNVENSSYGAAICAERTAAVKAVSEGYHDFEMIAIASNGSDKETVYPCGICRQFLHEFNPDLKVICAPTTVGIAAAAKYLQDEKSSCKLTGLGLPSEMLEYTGADDEHSCPYFYLWDMQGLGKLSALTTIALINDEITGAVDETFTAGDLGDYTITAADDGGTEVVLGAPLEFNPDNIEEMAKLY